MKISEIVQLLKAGYTKAEIAELRAAENEPIAEVPSVSPSPAEAGPIPPAENAQPEAAPADPAVLQEVQELKNLVGNMTRILQSQNIRNSSMPATMTPEETAENILASIINPIKEEK